jgi:hypothetical protein
MSGVASPSSGGWLTPINHNKQERVIVKKEDSYEKDGVPGYGKILPDNTYWTQIGLWDKEDIEQRGMKASTGRVCLEIQVFGSRIYARWQG